MNSLFFIYTKAQRFFNVFILIKDVGLTGVQYKTPMYTKKSPVLGIFYRKIALIIGKTQFSLFELDNRLKPTHKYSLHDKLI